MGAAADRPADADALGPPAGPLERNARAGRWVFPLMLGVFVLAQIPALFGLTEQAWWQGFARWFAGLPLT